MRQLFGMTDVGRVMDGTENDIAEVTTRAMEEAGELLKADWRAEIRAAGLGDKLANTIRSKSYPSRGKPSLDPAAWVDTKAPKIIDVFSRGMTIRARNAKWLAWPTEAAGAKRISPAAWEARTGLKLRFVPLRGGRSAFLVADNARLSAKGLAKLNRRTSRGGGSYTRLTGRTTVVVFTLHRSVTEKKLFDLDHLAARGADRVPGLIDKHWAQMPDRSAPMLMDDSGRPMAPVAPSRFKGVTW